MGNNRSSVYWYHKVKDKEKGISTIGIKREPREDSYIDLPPEFDYYKHRWCEDMLEDRFVIRLCTYKQADTDQDYTYWIDSRHCLSKDTPYPSEYKQRWCYLRAYKSKLSAEKGARVMAKKHKDNLASLEIITLKEALKELKALQIE